MIEMIWEREALQEEIEREEYAAQAAQAEVATATNAAHVRHVIRVGCSRTLHMTPACPDGERCPGNCRQPRSRDVGVSRNANGAEPQTVPS